jgi:CRP/FNR family transcriptional regulator, cyclic AMP receptor protein
MDEVTEKLFNAPAILATEGPGRSILRLTATQLFFSQGEPADAVFYLQHGRAKLTVVSKRGKIATVTMLAAGDFFGEESMAVRKMIRTATASAVSRCVAIKIDRAEMLRILHQGYAVSDYFMQLIVTRGIRTQADLVDQLFNSLEKRLARTLLLMAEFGQPGELETLAPVVTQETLAKMIGTTRSRVCVLMKRFRKLGYIEYNDRIRIHPALLNALLHDELPGQNASSPKLLGLPLSPSRTAKGLKSCDP